MRRPERATTHPSPVVRPVAWHRPRPGRGAWVLSGLALAGLHATPAHAQGSGLRITPSVSATQTFTDNRNLSATDKQADAITVLSPRVRVSSRSAHVQGSLDYALNGVFHARDSAANGIQHQLSGAASAELIESHLFLDARASIGQQAISALGVQSSRPTGGTGNSTELRTFSLSPTFRSRLFGDVDFVARATATVSRSSGNGGNIGDQSSQGASLRIGDTSRTLGWSVEGGRDVSDFDAGRKTTQDRLVATLSYAPWPDWRFFVNGGTERNDLQSLDARSSDTWGAGFTWQPGPRTQVNARLDRRFFGDGHSVGISHRMRRSVISFADSRSTSGSTAGAGATLTTYDLFFQQFAALEPDPALRDVLVRNFLAASGLDPNQRLPGGFLNAAVTLQRTQNLSLALQGQRSSAVLSAFATSSRRIDTLSMAQDDLSLVPELRQRGLNLSLSHRLTPTSSAVLSLSDLSSGSSGGNDLRSASLSWSGQVARNASLSATARHARSSGANRYSENTLSAAFNQSF